MCMFSPLKMNFQHLKHMSKYNIENQNYKVSNQNLKRKHSIDAVESLKKPNPKPAKIIKNQLNI